MTWGMLHVSCYPNQSHCAYPFEDTLLNLNGGMRKISCSCYKALAK